MSSAALVTSFACAAPKGCPPSATPAQSVQPATASDLESLPTYFAIELRQDGGVVIAGERVSDLDVLRERAAAALASVEGAAIYVADGVSAATFSEVVAVLVEAGYRRLRSVPGPAPRLTSEPLRPDEPSSGAGAEPPEVEAAAEAEAPQSAPAVGDVPSDVVVGTRGLHIGGGPNDDDEVKAVFINAVEAREADFRRCHLLAEERTSEGSFGVDLYIERGGGPPKVRDTRTGMGGPDFRACVIEVFSEIEFEPPPTGKPTVISYSIVFKPQR